MRQTAIMGVGSVKLKYKGMKKRQVKRRCNCGGGSRTTSFATVKTFYLPSGHRTTFRIGMTQTVSDSDGQFLIREFPKAFEVIE